MHDLPLGTSASRRTALAAVGAMLMLSSACSQPATTTATPTATADYVVLTSASVDGHAQLVAAGGQEPVRIEKIQGAGLAAVSVTNEVWRVAGERSLDMVEITREGKISHRSLGDRGVGLTSLGTDPSSGITWGILNGDSGTPGDHMPLVNVEKILEQYRLPVGHYTRVLNQGRRLIVTGYDVRHEVWSGRLAVFDKQSRATRVVDLETRGGVEECVVSAETEVACIEVGLPEDGEQNTHAVVVSTETGKVLARADLGRGATTVLPGREGVWFPTAHGLARFDRRLRVTGEVPLASDESVDSSTVIGDTAHIVLRYDARRPVGHGRADFGHVQTVDMKTATAGRRVPLVLPDADDVVTIRVMPRTWFTRLPA